MLNFLLNEEEVLNVLNGVDFLIIVDNDKKNFNFIPNINLSYLRRTKNDLKELFTIEKIFNDNISSVMEEEKKKMLEDKSITFNKYNNFDIQNKFITIYYENIEKIKNNILKKTGLTNNSSPLDLLKKRI